MCTVTIVPVSRGARLACNRDELRTRPAALPPLEHALQSRRAVWPVDPVSGGTWIAVNDAGLATTILNVNPEPADALLHTGKRSRGLLIPALMTCGTLAEARQFCSSIGARDYPPFRLVLLHGLHVAHYVSDGVTLRSEGDAVADRPLLFTSSGLGDALVEGPRRALFERVFAPGDEWERVQDAYHRHSWPERRHVSVCMEREAARTVSHTVIELLPRELRMTYTPDAPDRAGPSAVTSLALSGSCI